MKPDSNSGYSSSLLRNIARVTAYSIVGAVFGYSANELYSGKQLSYFPFLNSNTETAKKKTTIEEQYLENKLEPQGIITERVYVDVSINGGSPERLVIGLYGDDCPLTVTNFSKLCEGFLVKDKTLQYLGSKFHRIIPQFMIQGGDFTKFDGTGGQSEPASSCNRFKRKIVFACISRYLWWNF